MIIAIGGSIGSGKTTLAVGVSKAFGMQHVSAGQVMRDMAKNGAWTYLSFPDMLKRTLK